MKKKYLPEMEDEILLKALQKGEEQAFQALYQKYWQKLYYIAYQRIQSQKETEDILQDLFLDIWNKRKSLNIQKSFAGYIMTALKYKVLRWIDMKMMQDKYQANQTNTLIDNQLEQTLSFDELYALIEEGMDKLPEKCRIVFKMSREEQFSVKEIAEKIGISPHTAQNHINKALQLMRLHLKDYVSVGLFLGLIGGY
jgi:RNA polymerase sigma-70 factor (family 1)